MMSLEPNIEKMQKVELIAWGILLLIGAVFGLGKGFLFLIGVVLVVQGVLNWSVVPFLLTKLNIKI
jgi:hypothetical protein